jgi:nicotinate-nucleotide pyrophosphorylase (carboxylating)
LKLTPFDIYQVVERALTEDLSAGDPTTDGLIPPKLQGRALVIAKGHGVLAGSALAEAVWNRVDPDIVVTLLLPDGSALHPSDTEQGIEADVIAEVVGPMAAILKGERTVLNFMQRMSGIATETRRYVDAVKPYPAVILDTRKTVPGLRTLDKYAVAAGGGKNHRRNLGDGILMKDNHIAAAASYGLTLGQAIERLRETAPHAMKIEVEVEDLAQVDEALAAGAEILLLDNMSSEMMAEAVNLAKGNALTEASGNIVLENVAEVAATGVDMISVGALTHSVKALDLSLDFSGATHAIRSVRTCSCS